MGGSSSTGCSEGLRTPGDAQLQELQGCSSPGDCNSAVALALSPALTQPCTLHCSSVLGPESRCGRGPAWAAGPQNLLTSGPVFILLWGPPGGTRDQMTPACDLFLSPKELNMQKQLQGPGVAKGWHCHAPRSHTLRFGDHENGLPSSPEMPQGMPLNSTRAGPGPNRLSHKCPSLSSCHLPRLWRTSGSLRLQKCLGRPVTPTQHSLVQWLSSAKSLHPLALDAGK